MKIDFPILYHEFCVQKTKKYAVKKYTMKSTKFLISVCLGMLVYVILTITVGQDGIWAYKQLLEQKEVLATNVAKIQRINDTLKLDFNSINDDKAMISSRAKGLGLIFEGEKIIKITGISDTKMSVYDTGTAIRLSEINYVEESTCKILGLIVFAVCFLIMLVISLKHKHPVIIQENLSPLESRAQI